MRLPPGGVWGGTYATFTLQAERLFPRYLTLLRIKKFILPVLSYESLPSLTLLLATSMTEHSYSVKTSNAIMRLASSEREVCKLG